MVLKTPHVPKRGVNTNVFFWPTNLSKLIQKAMFVSNLKNIFEKFQQLLNADKWICEEKKHSKNVI